MADELNIDFGALKTQASELMDKAEAEREVAPAPPVVEPIKVAEPITPAAEVPVIEPPVPTEIPDDQLVKILVDGEEQILPWKEAKGKISGGLKFTKSMQQLAAERKAFDGDRGKLTALETEREQLRTFLSNKDAVLAFVAKQFGVSPAAAPQVVVDPNEIATVEQATQIAAAQSKTFTERLDEVTKLVDEKIQVATQQIDHARQVAAHDVVLKSTLNEIFTKNPVLQAIPDVEDIIRFNVAKLQPQTEADAVAAFQTVSQNIVEGLEKHLSAAKKVQAVAKAKLETKTIEPAGGTAPQVQPTDYKNTDGSVNWNKVTQAAKDFSATQ